MSGGLPGFEYRRLVRLMAEAVQRCKLNLQGAVVLTEAASGAYVVTPVLAAMAGADKVFALTHSSRYGSVEQISEQTYTLARMAGVSNRIEIVTAKTREIAAQADIVTNSGHVRPIDAETISWLKPSAVIPLMYEAWELREADVDVAACIRFGIQMAGTNERHTAVDVFSYLGIMAVKLLLDAGVAVYGSRVLLLCDNPFATYIERGLAGSGSQVDLYAHLADAPAVVPYDAVLVALQPKTKPLLNAADAKMIAQCWPGAVVAQYWGDIDRGAMAKAGIPLWPLEAPASGHMAVLPSAVGPEPIVRLQSGGLKVAEVLLRDPAERSSNDIAFLQWIDQHG